MSVYFGTEGTYNSGNIFSAELSNDEGFFLSPTVIGTLPLTGTNVSGTINITIPSGATASNDYHIRITSSNDLSGSLISLQELNVISSTPLEVSSPLATHENNFTTLSWTNPALGCWEQTMVVISSNPSFTFNPSGDGSAYTANPVYAAGAQVVYKDNGNLANIAGLTNGTIYYVKIFTRNGTNWSSDFQHEFLVEPICYPSYTEICDEYISNVSINTIDNSTAEGCGFHGYSWFVNQNTELVLGNTYTIDVQVGITGGSSITSYLEDDITIWIDWNGDNILSNNIGTRERIVNILDNGAAGSYTFTVPTSAVTGPVRMRVQLKKNGATNDNYCRNNFDFGETEDYTLNLVDACTPTISNFSFFPLSGSENTEVRISSTVSPGNFTSVTDVKFNDVSATSFIIEDENTIFAIVPEGAGEGRVTLVEGINCQKVSFGANSTFTYEKKDSTCNTYNDLFISEIQDPSSGNNHYIEIYNGTPQAIDLNFPNNYNLQIVDIDGIGINDVTTINIMGTILPGEVVVYYAGANGGLASGNQSNDGVTFDEIDEIRLVKDGIVIDQFVAPNFVSYNYRRKPDASSPISNYSDPNWTSHATSTANIGSFTPEEQIEITTHPSSQVGCEVNMNIVASGTGTITYQWYYNYSRNTVAVEAREWTSLINGTAQFTNTTISGATTPNLIIIGDLGQLSTYQFYCVVSNGTCSEYSHAAQFTAQPEPYFRSKQSGDWRLASSWEMSANGSTGWIDACTFPWDTNSVSVEIRNGHQILINEISTNTPDVKIDQLKILAGGELKIENTAELHLNNGTGTDLFVEGTLYDQGSSSGGNGVSFLDDAKWLLGADGTFIKSGNSSVTVYKDNYEGGIETIPATAHWIYRKETTVTPAILTNGMFYPNLHFENTYVNGATFTFTGNTDFLTVKGSLFIGVSDLTVFVSNNNSFSTPMKVLGDINIGSGSSYIIESSPIGTGLEVGGNITNDGTLDIHHLSKGILRLNGTNHQTIGGLGTFDIWDLVIDKTPKSLVLMNVDLLITNQLSFLGGIIDAQSYLLTLRNGDPLTAIIGFESPNNTGVYVDDRYVIGKLRRYIEVPNNIYIFPIGDDEAGMAYNPSQLTIRALPEASPFADGEFFPQDPGSIMTYRTWDCSGSMKFIEYTGFASDSYWKYEGSTFSNYDIRIHPNTKNPNVRPNEETIIGHTKTYRALKEESIKAGLAWDPNVAVQGDPCIVSDNYFSIIGASYSGFSIFSPGGGNGNTTALPVQLLYFDVNCKSDNPVLNWATASELNSDYFTIEKSSDGIQFFPIQIIPAAGNSNQKIEYSYNVPNSDIDNYYRLVQTDYDGSQYYHGIRSQECQIFKDNSYVYYQPYQGIVAQFNTNNSPISIEVFDASGRLMTFEKLTPSMNKHSISSSINWAKGVYFVRMLYSNNEVKTEKVATY